MSNARLTRTTSVLDLDHEETVDDAVVFSNIDIIREEGGDLSGYKTAIIHPQVWALLGQPSQITVTIEPGNTLSETYPGEVR